MVSGDALEPFLDGAVSALAAVIVGSLKSFFKSSVHVQGLALSGFGGFGVWGLRCLLSLG